MFIYQILYFICYNYFKEKNLGVITVPYLYRLLSGVVRWLEGLAGKGVVLGMRAEKKVATLEIF